MIHAFPWPSSKIVLPPLRMYRGIAMLKFLLEKGSQDAKVQLLLHTVLVHLRLYMGLVHLHP